jgi:hypothetical protein
MPPFVNRIGEQVVEYLKNHTTCSKYTTVESSHAKELQCRRRNGVMAVAVRASALDLHANTQRALARLPNTSPLFYDRGFVVYRCNQAKDCPTKKKKGVPAC